MVYGAYNTCYMLRISCSLPVVLYVSSPYGPCALARNGGPGGLASRAGDLGKPSSPPGEQEGFGARSPPNGHEPEDFTLASTFKKVIKN